MWSASISLLHFHYVEPPSLRRKHSGTASSGRPVLLVVSDQNTNPSPTAFTRGTQKSISNARESMKKYVPPSPPPTLTLENLPPLSDSQAIGTVAAAHANFFRVIVDTRPADTNSDGEGGGKKIELLCQAKMILKKMNRDVLVGDKVVVESIDWVDQKGVVQDVFQRSSQIMYPPAANIDHLLLLFSIKMPDVESFALTRFLVEAEADVGLIPFTLAFNKIELASPELLEAWRSRVVDWGYKPILFSVIHGYGIDELQAAMNGRTTIITGPTGVGKSSVINLLKSNDSTHDMKRPNYWFRSRMGSKWHWQQNVGEVSIKNGRGKHTTRNTCMLPLAGGGFVLDTPGFSFPSLLKHTRHSLSQAFPEIRERVRCSEGGRCAFRNCIHNGEPGCVVKADWERYPYYLQLVDEIKARDELQMRRMGKGEEEPLSRFYSKYGRPMKPKVKRLKKGWKRRSRMKLKEWVDEDAKEEVEEPDPAADGYLSDVFDFDALDKHATSLNPTYI